MHMKNCIIGQSGGPTVAINASLAGVLSKCKEYNCAHIYGMINGIKGLLDNTILDLNNIFKNEEDIECLKKSPAMYLGSCRYKLPTPNTDSGIYNAIFDKFKELEITDFFYIGGNDSMDTVDKLSKYANKIGSKIHFIGIPKTIDNDLAATDHTPGFGSAAKYVAGSMLEIAFDSSIYKLKSITIVEIMGRNAGWLTAASALAKTNFSSAPDLIYLPEVPFDKNKFLNDIQKLFKKKHSIIIAVSEGIKTKDGHYLDQDCKSTNKDAFGHIIHSGTGKILERLVMQKFNCKVRSIELNVLQRCAMHMASKTDIEEAFEIGQQAVISAKNGESAIMMIFKRISNKPYLTEIQSESIENIANAERGIPIDWINEDHNGIKKELYNYMLPLIQGEVELKYKNGIPSYINISHLNHSEI
ncbi:MAG: 6-phosphofructokinase [Candidatus Fimenecus sp.]